MTREGVRSTVIAALSTVVVVGLVAWAVTSSPNWPKVQRQFFSGSHLRDTWPDVLGGFWVNVQLFFWGMLLIPVVALAVALLRSLRGPVFFPLRVLSIVYIDVLRGMPLVLLLLLLGFGVPALDLPGLPHDPKFWGLVALTLSYSAYTAEIYRSGIDAVPESQRASARALGLNQLQALRYAILPQAIRNVVPALMNTVVSLQKDVALVAILGVREAVREAQIATSRSFNYTAYIGATLLFVAFSVPMVRLVDWYTKRDRARRTNVAV